MNKLNDTLRTQALSLGMCQKWQNEWTESWSKRTLADKLYEAVDFCIKNDFPKDDFIKRHFDTDILRSNNIFVDDKYSVVNPRRSFISGSSNITLRYNNFNSGHVWIKGKACLTVYTTGFSFALIHIFDDCNVNVVAKEKSRIALILHSKNAQYTTSGNITIKEEYGYLR